MLIVITSLGLWLGFLAARAVWCAFRAVPKRNADFGLI